MWEENTGETNDSKVCYVDSSKFVFLEERREDTFVNVCLAFRQLGGGQRGFLVTTSQLPSK